jgi:hypothetical protein
MAATKLREAFIAQTLALNRQLHLTDAELARVSQNLLATADSILLADALVWFVRADLVNSDANLRQISGTVCLFVAHLCPTHVQCLSSQACLSPHSLLSLRVETSSFVFLMRETRYFEALAIKTKICLM